MCKLSNYNYRFINIPKYADERGNLSVVESYVHIPFSIQRVYWMRDVPKGLYRGGEFHKKLRQVLLPIEGSFDVELEDGNIRTTITLDDPQKGLLIEPVVWRKLSNFSENAICLVFASTPYDTNDNNSNYNDFLLQKTL